jgi:hypothetical protein
MWNDACPLKSPIGAPLAAIDHRALVRLLDVAIRTHGTQSARGVRACPRPTSCVAALFLVVAALLNLRKSM